MYHTLKLLFILLFPALCIAQEKTEEIQKTINLKNNASSTVLVLANISGDIKVKSSLVKEIAFTINKNVTADTESQLQEGWENTTLTFDDAGDTIWVFMESKCQIFKKNSKKGFWYDSDCDDRKCREDYEYKFDFSVTVPHDLNIIASTINNGEITVDGVVGKIIANNINGGIAVKDAVGAVKLYTINGDVSINYKELPKSESSYYTLNGDINALFPAGLSADMHFNSFNGDFYTNIENVKNEPVVQKLNTKKESTAYKIKVKSNIKALSGGVLLDFETFNGDVYVKEN